MSEREAAKLVGLDHQTLKAIGRVLASVLVHTVSGRHEQALAEARTARDLLDMAIENGGREDYQQFVERLKSDAEPLLSHERDMREEPEHVEP